MFFSNKARQQASLETAEKKFSALVSEHIQTLARKRIQGILVDAYGVVDASRWMKECQHFVDKVVLPRFTDEEANAIADAGLSQIATRLLEHPVQEECKRIEKSFSYDEQMSPLDYERYCASQLGDKGWQCNLTKGSGDQGADVVAKKGDHFLVIQCKKYSNPVGNGAVQEVISAKNFLHANSAAVVTNASFTRAAVELASATGVLLLHHTDLDLIDEKLGLA